VREIGYPDPPTFSGTYELAGSWLDSLVTESHVEPGRTVLGGFSQGAVLAWALALGVGRPRPAAVLALSGFVPTVPGLALDLEPPLPRVAIGHGALDPVISVDWGRRARDLAGGAGADLLYHESPVGHTIDPAFLRALVPWVADAVPGLSR
jgi:phospholipase/carboxylesterase